MLRCVGLACYEIDAAIMRNAQSLVIHQDVSQLTLLVRFSLCTSDLCVVKGLFGLTDLENGSHACLLAATERVVRLFCCDDDDLVQHVRAVTELIDMDAASDEQLAGRLMRASGAFFPGAKQVLRDPTHATRRLLSRPFAAIPQIATIHSTLVTGLNAMPHTIQCSGVLGNVFSKHCSELDSHAVTGKRIKSLQMRHHRFDSAQKPACRMILYIKPVILTAIYAAVHRSLVLLAMMSDAADEVITLLRVLDTENFEMAEISLEIDSMLSRLKYLFLQEHVWDCGYTAYILEELKQPTAFLVRGQPKTLGGVPSRALLQECLGVMKTFVYLCSETVVAEFPVIDICSAFRIFDLSIKGRDRGAETAEHLPDTRDCAARLCQAFDVPLEPLLHEFWDHRRIAMHHAISHDCGSFAAWREAVYKTSARSGTADRHPSDHLRELLIRLGAWGGGTTSGVERQFAQKRTHITADRKTMDVELQRLEMKIVSDFDRCGPEDCGEQAFVKKRREQTHSAATLENREKIRQQALEDVEESMLVDQRVQAELHFQAAKQHKNKIQAYLDDAVLEDDVDPEMLPVIEDYLDRRSQVDRERTTRTARKHTLMATAPPAIGRRLVFVDNECLPLANPAGHSLTAAMHAAEFWVVPDPASPPVEVLWTAGLQGGCVVNAEYVQGRGIAFVYDCAIKTRRKIYICDRFVSAEPGLADVLTRSLAKSSSQWRVLSSWDEFAEASDRCCGPQIASHKRRWLEVVALTTPE
ncbi:unnamed protein product, partial [Symbiodinium sp. CCMP2456]